LTCAGNSLPDTLRLTAVEPAVQIPVIWLDALRDKPAGKPVAWKVYGRMLPLAKSCFESFSI
jgi:hypothetical protein